MLSADEAARRTRRRAKITVVSVATALVVVVMVLVAFLVNTAGSGKVRPGHSAPGDVAIPQPGGNTGGSKGPVATLNARTVRWRDFYGNPLPTSDAGPKHFSGGLASGFDHSPDGALLAAVHVQERSGTSVGPKVFEPTITNQMVGVDKDAYLSKVEAEYQRVRGLQPVGPNGEITADFVRSRNERSGVWGYRIDAYSDSTAFIQVLLQSTPNGAQGTTYVNVGQTLKWIQGDWRLTVPPQGEWMNVSRIVPNPPSDYTSLVS